MTERDAFMDAIRESPDDDTPRLIFADWLDERGETDRAEFIRVQCELETLPISSPRRELLRASESLLLHAQEAAWRAELPSLPGIRWGAFERGFVGRFEVDTIAAFETHADAILAAPVLPELILTDTARPAVAALTSCRRLDRLCGLQLVRTRSNPEQLAGLFNSDRLGRLGRLAVLAQPMRRAAVRALVRTSCLAGLRDLYLFEVGLGTRGAVALASSPHLRRLTALGLQGNAIGPEGAVALAQSPVLGSVTNLSLTYAGVGPAVVQALAALPQLRRLELNANHVGDAGAKMLAGSPHLGYLESLFLRSNDIGDPGAIALGQSPTLAALHVLDLDDNRVTDAGLAALLDGATDRRLCHLGLDGNPLTVQGRRALERHTVRNAAPASL